MTIAQPPTSARTDLLSADEPASLDALITRIEATEKLARRAAAESYLNGFHYLLATMKAEHPTFSAAELTPYFIQHVDKGKLLRKATPAYAQLRGITEKKAANALHHAVNLIQHAPQLLQRLHDGEIPAELVQAAGQKLKSVTPPHPKRNPAGQPWTPEEHQEALAETDDAKDLLGDQLTDLARPGIPEQDFLNQAGKLREQHHPQPASERHASAAKRRYVHIVPAADGMSRLEALIAADDAAQIAERLKHRAAASQQATPEGRTRTQIEADLLVADLTGTGRSTAAEPPESQASAEYAQPAKTITVFLEYTFEDWIRTGGMIAEGQLEFLRDYKPELFEEANRNRQFHLTPPSRRRGKHPPGVLGSGAHATVVGTGQQLSTELSAALLPQAAMMQAIITHPVTGYPIGLSKRARHPSRRVKELLLYRDRHCRFPGCHVPGTECEVDHIHDWVLSQNSELYGLALMCRRHHGGKSAGWWRVQPRPDEGEGVLEFTFHTGRTVLTRPARPLDPAAWDALREQLEAPPF